MHLVRAELRKTLTLPATAVALAIATIGPIALAVLNAFHVRDALTSGRTDKVGFTSAAEAALSAVPLGTAGAMVLGVVAISSEYTANSTDAGGGRQISTTLMAAPRRWTLLAAKAVVVVALVVLAALVSLSISLVAAVAIIGDAAQPNADEPIGRFVGAGLYWALAALMALAITVLARSGIVPLIVLITNGTVVSVSFLLWKVTPLARYLPDLAGTRLFAGESFTAVDDALPPITGGLVMTAWAVALLLLAGVVLNRRDA
jgi:ABC-2 type transport system permease protein